MTVTDEMLDAAMRQAIEIGSFPKFIDAATYLKNWAGMKQALQAALDVVGS